MTDLLKAEVIGALRERLCAVRDAQLAKAGDFGAGWRAQYIEAIDSFDLTPFQVKVPAQNAEQSEPQACQESDGCPTERAALQREWRALSAQLAERDREIAELRAGPCPRCRGSGKIDDADPGDISYNEFVCPECNGTGTALMTDADLEVWRKK